MKIVRYEIEHEAKLISLLKIEPDWGLFIKEDAVKQFKKALLDSETFICESSGEVCGYIRALVDAFGAYVSELYVAPTYRNKGYGRKLLNRLRVEQASGEVYVFSDEDVYYEKLGLSRVGSIFKM